MFQNFKNQKQGVECWGEQRKAPTKDIPRLEKPTKLCWRISYGLTT